MTSQYKATVVSVIIPCYRQAHFLSEALESALAQTHSPVEVVVVDDGSPDDTAEVVACYPTVSCVRQSNMGLAKARNAGFRASRGDYLCFLDADDRLTPDAVDAHLACFERNPDAGFVVGDIDHITVAGVDAASPRWPLLKADQYEELLKVNHVANTIAVMFRRAVIKQLGGFDPACSPAEDYDLLLRAARAWPGAHHDTVVAQYRRHTGTISRRGTTMLRATNHVMRSQREIVAGNPKLEKARRQGVRYWREHFGRATIKQIFEQLSQFHLWSAFNSLVTLCWHARGTLPVIPWHYAKRLGQRTLRSRAEARVARRAQG